MSDEYKRLMDALEGWNEYRTLDHEIVLAEAYDAFKTNPPLVLEEVDWKDLNIGDRFIEIRDTGAYKLYKKTYYLKAQWEQYGEPSTGIIYRLPEDE